ncbi:MAG: DUF2312 domain-containing protein [Acidobacteria bacterium]|nr:DUF2312 domain-containing protein [Acidobacteriota bacterium]
MSRFSQSDPRQRLVFHVQELERLEELKKEASNDLKQGFEAAKAEGYDTTTLKVVLKLRKMTAGQRQERRALEAIYMAALGMLEGDALPEEARRRLDPPSAPPEPKADDKAPQKGPKSKSAEAPRPKPQPVLPLKEPAEARAEGVTAAEAGKRIYDNPYPAGDPCRAAWDEGWCSAKKSNGMETPEAYQRRKSPDDGSASSEQYEQGAASDEQKKGAA